MTAGRRRLLLAWLLIRGGPFSCPYDGALGFNRRVLITHLLADH